MARTGQSKRGTLCRHANCCKSHTATLASALPVARYLRGEMAREVDTLLKATKLCQIALGRQNHTIRTGLDEKASVIARYLPVGSKHRV